MKLRSGSARFYNGSIGLNEDVTKQWSNVENAYQLRADKTKNLVEIVKVLPTSRRKRSPV